MQIDTSKEVAYLAEHRENLRHCIDQVVSVKATDLGVVREAVLDSVQELYENLEAHGCQRHQLQDLEPDPARQLAALAEAVLECCGLGGGCTCSWATGIPKPGLSFPVPSWVE